MSFRLPNILGKAIGDVHQTLNQEVSASTCRVAASTCFSRLNLVGPSFQTEEERIIDLVNCIHRMEDLMDDLQGNSRLRPIIDGGAGDIALWNKEIAKYFLLFHFVL
jgi:hypothetical protein